MANRNKTIGGPSTRSPRALLAAASRVAARALSEARTLLAALKLRINPPGYTALFPDFYAQPWKRLRGSGRTCCLTFDDGPSPNTDLVLETLDRYGVKATFFVVGAEKTADDQERLRKIVAAGHTLAMHSWSHDHNVIYSSVEAFLTDLHRVYCWIYEATGVYPQLFRFPYGSNSGYNRATVYRDIIAEMARRGFTYYDWNISARDAVIDPRPAAEIAANCLQGIGREFVVVLSHDSTPRLTTAEAMPAVIEGYRSAGYAFSSLRPGMKRVQSSLSR